jgi:hypothetical protein
LPVATFKENDIIKLFDYVAKNEKPAKVNMTGNFVTK